ncbi:hypothetical protein MLD38_013223 [Melastoma candidum]|uniref:Uncharacterized protein n=1 Tax=Melastoma candidum TaxID=119954 RepID=A0ACB9R8V3_9MYRT|nr:hypothetical protein MLD38_013223 [Melastoma candidum]
MNSSHYMDKQIMDLAASPIPSSTALSNDKDFIDLGTHQDADHGIGGGTGTGSDRDGGVLDDRIGGREEIVPSYDFQPLRPSNSLLKTSSIPGIRNYSSLDSFEPAKVIVEKDNHSMDTALLLEINRTMKKHTDSLLHALEGVSARLTQLETRARNLENSVDDLKVSVGNNHESPDGKTRYLENILKEVQTGVQAIKDKQEILETQLQMAKVYVSPAAPPTDAVKPAEAWQLSPPLPSQPPPQSMPVPSIPNTPPTPSVPQPNLTPPLPQVQSQFPTQQVPLAPQRDPYFQQPGHGQNQEAPTQHQPYPLASAQMPHPPPAVPPPHQQYPPHSQPQYHPPAHPSQPHPSGPPLPSPQSQLSHHAEEAPYPPHQTFQPNMRQSALQPPTGPPPATQQYYGAGPQMYEQPPPPRSSSEYSTGYGLPSGPSEPSYGSGPQYGSSSPMKPQQHPPGGGMGSGYPQLPSARTLPHALPTASAVSGGSGSAGSGNRVPIDDVVDKVTSMGFSRDQVRATVRRLTENGQAVDLNIVLDKLMNDSDVQPPRGWFGR